MRRTAIMLAGFVIALTLGATAQENRTLAVSWWDTVITSIAGFLRKGTTVTTETLKSILLVSENPGSKPTCIQSLATWR